MTDLVEIAAESDMISAEINPSFLYPTRIATRVLGTNRMGIHRAVLAGKLAQPLKLFGTRSNAWSGQALLDAIEKMRCGR